MGLEGDIIEPPRDDEVAASASAAGGGPEREQSQKKEFEIKSVSSESSSGSAIYGDAKAKCGGPDLQQVNLQLGRKDEARSIQQRQPFGDPLPDRTAIEPAAEIASVSSARSGKRNEATHAAETLKTEKLPIAGQGAIMIELGIKLEH